MSDLLRSTFPVSAPVPACDSQPDKRGEFRQRAIESISGSMVFVEDAILYWDLEDE